MVKRAPAVVSLKVDTLNNVDKLPLISGPQFPCLPPDGLHRLKKPSLPFCSCCDLPGPLAAGAQRYNHYLVPGHSKGQ